MNDNKTPLAKETLEDIHTKMKHAIAGLGDKENWSIDQIAIGMAITLGDFISFADAQKALPISKDDYRTMCVRMVDVFMEGDEDSDLKTLLH